MRLPKINQIPTSQQDIGVFRGYNHNPIIGDGEFYDETNMSSDRYPLLSPRKKRGTRLTYKDYATSATGTAEILVTINKTSYMAKMSSNFGETTFTYTDGAWHLGDETVILAAYGITVVSGTPVEGDTLVITLFRRENPNHSYKGIVVNGKFCYVDGTTFYIDNVPSALTNLSDTPKTLVPIGARVVIFPDKVMVSVNDVILFQSLELHQEIPSGTTFEIFPCTLDSQSFAASHGSTAPQNPSNGDYWIETNADAKTPDVLKIYSAANDEWTEVAPTNAIIKASSIGADIAQYDGIQFLGLSSKKINGTYTILDRSTNYIVITEAAVNKYTNFTSTAAVKLNRNVPDFDYVCESGNRIWGCKFDYEQNINEIYASKLGDPTNFSVYMGASTDSYAATIGANGKFTGCVTYGGYPIFFKEDSLHKVYGTMPSNFQIQSTVCRGVADGSSKSLVIVDNVLYYLSPFGVCAYDGSLPTEISDAFGNIRYADGVGGGYDSKYYLSAHDDKGIWHLLVYDASRGLWHREDNTHADGFATMGDEMYYIDHDTQTIKTVSGSGILDEAPVEWFVETGDMSLEMTEHKHLSQILIRMSLDLGTLLRAYIRYDSCGEWTPILSMNSKTLRSFCLPIRPHRCDHFRLRVYGRGDGKIYSIAKTIERGSDND